jgi:UPF0716 protein FxsA
MPATELADGALVLIGGTLILAPGFLTDVFGLLMILPVTRPPFRMMLTAVVSRRFVRTAGGQSVPGQPGQGPVVPGEVVNEPAAEN